VPAGAGETAAQKGSASHCGDHRSRGRGRFARVFLWECSYERLRSAQLLDRRGVFLTHSLSCSTTRVLSDDVRTCGSAANVARVRASEMFGLVSPSGRTPSQRRCGHPRTTHFVYFISGYL
jgi:hypothetical protein